MSVKIMLKGTVEEIERFEREMLYPGIRLANAEHGDPQYFKLTQNDGRYFPSKVEMIKVRYWGGYFPDKKKQTPAAEAGEDPGQ